MDLPFIIVLKQYMLVELIGGNYAIDNDFVNGAKGVFKKYTKDKVDIV